MAIGPPSACSASDGSSDNFLADRANSLRSDTSGPYYLGHISGNVHVREEPSAGHSYNCRRQSWDDQEHLAYNARIASLRPVEYPQLGLETTYLDHAGTTLPSRSLVSAFAEMSMSTLLGNPHSGSAGLASQTAARKVEDVRLRTLRWLNADPNDFDLIFVANATAGIKLVSEGLRGWMKTRHNLQMDNSKNISFAYHAEAHTSVIGLREEFHDSCANSVQCIETDSEIEKWLDKVHADREQNPCLIDSQISLLAYPAQSNMNGRQLPLHWRSKARSSGVYTLLDAAAFVPTSQLDLSDPLSSPDFTVLSFYKIFGLPDLGALIVNKTASHLLRRKRYFGGGTVEMVSVLSEQWHMRKQESLHEILEDGTLPVHNIAMLESAFDAQIKLFGGIDHISRHTTWLAGRLYRLLTNLKHWNGAPVCKIYGKREQANFGPTLAFNIMDSQGSWASTFEFEKLASARNIQVRTGSVCNPGGVASALDLSPWQMQANFSAGLRCGGDNDVIDGKPTGIIRVSLGAMSTLEDVEVFVNFVKEFFAQNENSVTQNLQVEQNIVSTGFHIESLTIYPIKSCSGWSVPQNLEWHVRAEGLAWDREWCLVHEGTHKTLSQKRNSRMALLKPRLDFERGLLIVTYKGSLPLDVHLPLEVVIPLSLDPSFYLKREKAQHNSSICGQDVQMQICSSSEVNRFFSALLETPCQLARFPPSSAEASTRHTKPHLQVSGKPSSEIPLLLSNESPILIVSRSSLNLINEKICSNDACGKSVSVSVFRPNVVLSEDRTCLDFRERPWVEDSWESVTVTPCWDGLDHGSAVEKPGARRKMSLDILGPCRRCQMVCIDQDTGEKNPVGEPFASLNKIRKKDGKVWFGMHAALRESRGAARLKVGDRVEAFAKV